MSNLAREDNPMMPEEAEGPGGLQPAEEHSPPAPGSAPGVSGMHDVGPGVTDPGMQHQEPMQGGQEVAMPSPDAMSGAADPMGSSPDPSGFGSESFAHGAAPMPAPGAATQHEAELSQEPAAPDVPQEDAWTPPDPAAAAPTQQPQPVAPADVRAKPLPRINIQAFCEDQNTANILQQVSQDRRLSKAHVSVQMGGLDAASHYYRNAPTPNLIIIESMLERDALVMDLDRLASVCDSGTKVIIIGHVNDVLLYRELLHRGVSEYLVMPLTVPQLMESLSNLYNVPGSDPLGSVIAFVGAKGGVGSSTVCHNTAWAISQSMKSDVVIADFDLPFGTAGLDFNQDPVQGIADALLSPERLDDVLLDRLLSRCSDYLSLFAAPGTLDRPYDFGANACDVVMDVLRKNIPYIVVDVPHLWTEWAQRVLVQSDRVVITALPDLANLRNTKNLFEKLSSVRPNDLLPMLVINQVKTPKRPEISVKDFASAVECQPQSVIEFDSQLFGTATNNGQMIEEVSPKAKVAEQFRDLARIITDRTEVKAEAKSKSVLGPILSKLHLKRSGK